MGQKDVEREKPLFEGQSAEEFIKRWNAITKAIKMRRDGRAGKGGELLCHTIKRLLTPKSAVLIQPAL